MTDNSSGTQLVGIIFLLVVLAILGLMAWAYFKHTENLLVISSIFELIVFVFSLVVIAQVGGRWDVRWGYKYGVPFFSTIFFGLLIWKIKSQLGQEIVSETQSTNLPSFSFAEVIPDQPKMIFKHFLGLLFITPGVVWCGLALLYNFNEETQRYSTHALRSFADWVGVVVLILLIATLLVFG